MDFKRLSNKNKNLKYFVFIKKFQDIKLFFFFSLNFMREFFFFAGVKKNIKNLFLLIFIFLFF